MIAHLNAMQRHARSPGAAGLAIAAPRSASAGWNTEYQPSGDRALIAFAHRSAKGLRVPWRRN